MRHPITLGAVVLGALLLALVCLLHLVAVRRTTAHRLRWAAISLSVPVLGPLAYLFYGRTRGHFDEDNVYVAYAPPPPTSAPVAPLPRIAPVRIRPAPLPPADRPAPSTPRPDEG